MFDPGFLKGPVGVIVYVDIVLCGDGDKAIDRQRGHVYTPTVTWTL